MFSQVALILAILIWKKNRILIRLLWKLNELICISYLEQRLAQNKHYLSVSYYHYFWDRWTNLLTSLWHFGWKGFRDDWVIISYSSVFSAHTRGKLRLREIEWFAWLCLASLNFRIDWSSRLYLETGNWRRRSLRRTPTRPTSFILPSTSGPLRPHLKPQWRSYSSVSTETALRKKCERARPFLWYY